jgi:hypothetical protein
LDTGEDSAFIRFRRDKLAEEVRKHHLPDFSNWKNHDAFEAAFARLEKDLRTKAPTRQAKHRQMNWTAAL